MGEIVMNIKKDGAWNPYLAGALAGVLLVASVFFTGKYFGASTSFVRTAGLIEKVFSAEHVASLEYFTAKVPKIEWQWMFVAGILIGSFLAAVTSGSFKWQAVPDMWRERFGTSVAKRAAAAFSGGVLSMLGARLAGGCPSGHGLSGSLQLAVSGYVALVCFFAGGLLAANFLYRRDK